MINRIRRYAAAALLAAASVALGADWPNYRGPNHDQKSAEKIGTTWPLKEVWRKPVGPGFGTISVAGGKAFYFGEKGRMEHLYAWDALTGKDLWQIEVGPTTDDRQGGPNPRSTPTVDGERVYLLSTYLKLMCFNAADGKVIWQHDLTKTHGARNIKWDNAASPIIEGDLVIVTTGAADGSFLALDKATGKTVWKTGGEAITHATPTPATIHGTRQIIFYTQAGISGVEPKTGKVLWQQAFPFRISTAISPVVGDDIVYVSAGYGVGAGAYRINKSGEKWSVQQLWRKENALMNHWSTPLYHDGHLYGVWGFRAFKTGPLKCVELATGNEKWSHDGFGHGGTIIIDGHLLVLGEEGQLVLAKATPEGYKEVARHQPVKYKCWTMPIVANGHVYIHSGDEAVCLKAE